MGFNWLQSAALQLARNGYIVLNSKLQQCFVFVFPVANIQAYLFVVIVHLFQLRPFVRFFRFQFILLFDALDSTTGRIAPILESATPLFHAHNLLPVKSTHLQRPVQITHRNRYELIIRDIWYRTWRKWSLPTMEDFVVPESTLLQFSTYQRRLSLTLCIHS